MNTSRGLSLRQVLTIGFATEITLFLFQFLTLKVYLLSKADQVFSFSSEYMRTTGFYVFLIAGFFLYLFVVSSVLHKIDTGIIRKLVGLIVIAAVMELGFYLFIAAAWQAVFWYSIISKVIATAFGVIVFNVSADHVQKPESYF